MTQPAAGPLEGLTVIEMGTLIAGPFCGQILGDFGAEVIKIEDPAAGDPMRQWGRSLPKGHSPWWPVIGRNKKSVTLHSAAAGKRNLGIIGDRVEGRYAPVFASQLRGRGLAA